MSIEWRPIPGWEQFYEVSSDGRVRATLPEMWRGCIKHGARTVELVQTIGGRAKNYKRVMLNKGKKRHAYVHHLVAEAFIGPRPEGAIVLHMNDKGFDNRVENIRYGDREENEMDRHVARVAKHLEPAPF